VELEIPGSRVRVVVAHSASTRFAAAEDSIGGEKREEELSAISYQLSAISYQLSAISYQLSAISYQLSAIGTDQSDLMLCQGIFWEISQS
jgi:hypothetical protein